MSKTVFVLGAGASAAAGIPTMATFLEAAEELFATHRVDNYKSFELVFDAIGRLPQAHTKASLDIDNVESVFSAFEMAKVINLFGDYSYDQISQLDGAMRSVIAQTIHKLMRLPVQTRTDGRYVASPIPYDDFADLLRTLSENASAPSVITFNYDIACDFAFLRNEIPIVYSLDEAPAIGIPLLKLHGSLNWAHCDHCGSIVPWLVPLHLTSRQWSLPENVRSIQMHSSSDFYNMRHCERKITSGAVIVPPTWAKSAHHLGLTNVWRRAGRELAAAENIFVAGYSLPPSDAFFRYLYALGTLGPSRIRRFWVFNPDPSVEARFRELLGPAVQSRFRFFRETFQNSLAIMRSELRSAR